MSEQQNIFQRINEIRKQVGYLQKDANVQGYKAITHDMVTSALREHLIEQCILIVPRQMEGRCIDVGQTAKGATIIRYEADYEVDFVNGDNPEDKVTVRQESHANDHGDKAPGKACSYAVKYAMLKLFSIETGESEESRVEIAEKTKKINSDQVKTIKKALADTGANEKGFLASAGRKFSNGPFQSIETIPAIIYDDCVALIESNAQQRAASSQ